MLMIQYRIVIKVLNIVMMLCACVAGNRINLFGGTTIIHIIVEKRRTVVHQTTASLLRLVRMRRMVILVARMIMRLVIRCNVVSNSNIWLVIHVVVVGFVDCFAMQLFGVKKIRAVQRAIGIGERKARNHF